MLKISPGVYSFLAAAAGFLVVASFAPCYPFSKVNFIGGLVFSVLFFYAGMSACGTCTVEEEYGDEEQLFIDFKNSLKD